MSTRVIAIVFLQKNLNTEALAESFLRLTPQVSHRPGEAIFLEIGRCHRLYNEDSAILKVEALLRRLKLHAHIAVASDPATAFAKAKGGLAYSDAPEFETRNALLCKLPLESLVYFLDPFEKDIEKEKQTTKLIEHLLHLGLSRLAEFIHLPQTSLPSRFGRLALELYETVKYGHNKPWPRLTLEETISETLALGDGTPYPTTQDLEPLLFLLRPLLERVVLRLRGRGQRALAIKLQLDIEPFSTIQNTTRVFSLELSLPQGSSRALFDILKERLYKELRQTPLGSSVQDISLEITQTAPGAFAQKDFFLKTEEEKEKWNTLVARLHQRLGDNNAYVAALTNRYLPEAAWKKVAPKELKTISPNQKINPKERSLTMVPARPNRLLSLPRPLVRSEDKLTCPALNKSWSIKKVEGPERLLGEWWDQLFHREYFKVVSAQGEQLWVFQDLQKPKQQFFLHGFFD